MPETCCAVGYSNRRGRKEGLSFHRFPEDEERRRKWVAAVNSVATQRCRGGNRRWCKVGGGR